MSQSSRNGKLVVGILALIAEFELQNQCLLSRQLRTSLVCVTATRAKLSGEMTSRTYLPMLLILRELRP